MKKNYSLKACFAFFLLIPSLLQAQGGVLDQTNFGGGVSGGSAFLSAATITSGQKILIGGSFTTVGSSSRNNFCQLNTDGSVDVGFSVGTSANGIVRSIVIQPDDKILIGGLFTQYNGNNRARIARINTDGSIDNTFNNTGTGLGGAVFGIGIQSDGKIIAVGQFTDYNSTTSNRIVRLNTDGTLDASFTTNIGTGANNSINRVVVLSDDRIIIVGAFTSFNSVSSPGIALLNANGTLDATFSANIGTGANAVVEALAVQSDGKILIGGSFTQFNSATVGRVVRLNSDGTTDGTFATNIGTGANVGAVFAARELSNGKILLGGSFTQFNGLSRSGIVQLTANGTPDADFVPGAGANAQINNFGVQSDGKIVLAGAFGLYNGTSRSRIARLCGDLTVAATAQTATISSVSATNQFALGSAECTILARVLPNGATPVSGNVTVQTFIDPTVQSYNGTVYAQRHFEITPASGSTGRVTLYFTQADFDAFNSVPNGLDLPTGPTDLTGISNIRIMKFDGSSGGTGDPADYAGTGTVINPLDADIVWNAAASKWEISFNVTGFSGFFLQTSTFLLPVTLTDFTAKAVGDRAELRWLTASEQNSKQFVVERSLNGTDFVAIGRINAAGNSSSERVYTFNDNLSRLPHNGTVYYRLQMKDLDGSTSFSRVATVKSGRVNIGASLLGNPVNGVAKVLFQSTNSDRLTIRVIDSRGQVVMQSNQQIAAGSNQFSLNTAGLPRGIYVLEIQGTTNERSSLRMIKE